KSLIAIIFIPNPFAFTHFELFKTLSDRSFTIKWVVFLLTPDTILPPSASILASSSLSRTPEKQTDHPEGKCQKWIGIFRQMFLPANYRFVLHYFAEEW